ncbi:microcompartments protein [Thermovirga lienii DSM 17291]|uniref:Microcompartments protein n=1 Tax=Thermovirga lienii (strain ATCC BAA-1197 / DSM 17291 / Cas60314) TaxID=580340 RepID=G7V6C6_THELD|nr:BMC domain-containing protein [Thermovirga lienii]AER65955.1 microcompartments protein [Thermovirga lienii DSM 17291]
MEKALATIESISVARGYQIADSMLKSASISLYYASTTCPGKFLIIVGGQVSAVKTALNRALDVGKEMVVDYMFLPNIHPQVISALTCSTEVKDIKDLGVVEAMSAPSVLEAADAAVKASRVNLIEVRVGRGMGSKSFFSVTGDISDVKNAVKAAEGVISSRGLLVEAVVISRPHKDLVGVLG